MKRFIGELSVVRKIWSTTDITLFIFAGASAEFALNKQVDWLYFTGKLPADPIGRLFSTIHYAHQIIFSDETASLASIEQINKIHRAVEASRQLEIPHASYKDVLFMLIHYSIASFELVERKLTIEEKNEVVQVFHKIGERMNMNDIPQNYSTWINVYRFHLQHNLANSSYTKDLFKQYRKHLGAFRFFVLIEIQKKLIPSRAKELLRFGPPFIVNILMPAYKLIRKLKLHNVLMRFMVPKKYRKQFDRMNQANAQKK